MQNRIHLVYNLLTRKDSFTERSVSQTSLSFEKASILYNFAASHSKLGAQQDRFELTGLKQAFSYYLASSSLLKHIRTTFINPPTDDLQSGVLTFLEEVMLCQAQEILIEKSRDENKSDQLVARLASHCHEVYYKLECESKETFQTDMKQIREILILVKCKALYYSALASYHQSLASKTLNMYPEIISYLKVATDDCERCKKEAKNFETASSSFWQKLGFEGGVDDTSPGRNLMLLIDNLQSAIKVANAQAIKDNDMIYNAQLIPRQSLKIDKVQAVQQSSLKNVLDAFGRPTTDLFANLISMTTHVQASLYSDKLDAMVRNYKDQVLHADTELENAITGQDLENFVTNAKMALVSNIESAHVMPDSLLTAVFELRQIEVQNDSSHRIERLQTLIDQFKTSCKNFEVSLIGEEVQNTKNQSQFLDRWTLPSSARANYNIKERLGQLSAEVAHFEFMVKELREKQVSLVPWIKVVLMESDSIRKLFSNECTPVVNFSPAHEIGPSEGLRLCEKLETSLASLYQQRLDRESIFVNIMKTVLNFNRLQRTIFAIRFFQILRMKRRLWSKNYKNTKCLTLPSKQTS